MVSILYFVRVILIIINCMFSICVHHLNLNWKFTQNLLWIFSSRTKHTLQLQARMCLLCEQICVSFFFGSKHKNKIQTNQPYRLKKITTIIWWRRRRRRNTTQLGLDNHCYDLVGPCTCAKPTFVCFIRPRTTRQSIQLTNDGVAT